ncbi:MAG: aminotransferase class I/II-fold pyridoxal phosphate-dependent enzyme [Lachnospiraceae bacterium]|jgi:cystathionine beta-lyase|nr:aminotransferase class I/II-fold pyridoxal phosphate-dependent enzyme [Lachnospiraceae bacterium]
MEQNEERDMGYDFETIAKRERMGSLKLAMTPEVLREKGLVSFAAGEMDFPTAPSLVEAVVRAAENGLFGFTLKDETYLSHVLWWMEKARNWQIRPEWVVTAYGTIFSVATCIRAFVGRDERVIVQPPFYSRYQQAADRLGRQTVYNPMVLEEGCYRMDLAGLERLMADPGNRMLILCNPHNPSGRVFTRQELAEVARLSARYKTIVFSDEIFAEVIPGGRPVTPYASLAEGQRHAITCTSLGKAFNCTGMNLANVIIPDEDLRTRFQAQRDRDHYGSIDPGAYAAVTGAYSPEGFDWLQAMVRHVKECSDYVHGFMKERLWQFPVLPTEGGFVCWIDFGALKKPAEELEGYLLEKALFHVDPGIGYGGQCGGFARMNLASTRKQLKGAMERLEKVWGGGR